MRVIAYVKTSVGTYRRTMRVFLVEDNIGDVHLAQEAFGASGRSVNVHVARDRSAAMRFLRKEGAHIHVPRPNHFIGPELAENDWTGCARGSAVRSETSMSLGPSQFPKPLAGLKFAAFLRESTFDQTCRDDGNRVSA
jgi:hypothetical protein